MTVPRTRGRDQEALENELKARLLAPLIRIFGDTEAADALDALIAQEAESMTYDGWRSPEQVEAQSMTLTRYKTDRDDVWAACANNACECVEEVLDEQCNELKAKLGSIGVFYDAERKRLLRGLLRVSPEDERYLDGIEAAALHTEGVANEDNL